MVLNGFVITRFWKLILHVMNFKNVKISFSRLGNQIPASNAENFCYRVIGETVNLRI
jgi:hypothetical protein